MGQVVGGFTLPHEPGVFYMPEAKWTDGQRRVLAAFEQVKKRIGELRATTVIIVGADHYVLFGPACLPSFLIGIGDVSGPYERFPGMQQDTLPNNEALATHIARHGRDHGFDWAVSRSLHVDHSIGVPARLCALPNASVRGIVPVYLASGVEPLIATRRAYQLGGAIRDAVEALDDDERVVMIGSGGISHWVGLPQMGQVNERFDRFVLDCVTQGDAESLIGMSDGHVLEEAGNGALEIRNFICVMGAMPGCGGHVIAYERGKEWVTGLGFAEIGAEVAIGAEATS